ncbi:MAG: DJ-1/PfpI family protein [Bacteroidota bacterium]
MQLALLVFPDLTLLDLVGVYDPLQRLRSLGILPNLEIHCCAFHQAPTDSFGFPLAVDRQPKSLAGYDLIFVPGGKGTRTLRYDQSFIQWLSTAAAVPIKSSVCTGSLLLGAAGLLGSHRATTHYAAYEALREWTDRVVEGQKLVDDGPLITAGAVAASLDLGLHLCERLAGKEARLSVARSMNYHQ